MISLTFLPTYSQFSFEELMKLLRDFLIKEIECDCEVPEVGIRWSADGSIYHIGLRSENIRTSLINNDSEDT